MANTNEFRVNTYTNGSQNSSSVVALTGGGFVVTWTSDGQDGSDSGIYGQRYNASGVAVGNEFRVNTYTTDRQESSSVTALTGGGFVVTWNSYGQDGSDWGIYGQRYDANGAAVGNEFRVNTYTVNTQDASSVAALPGGGFVVTWTSYRQDGGYSDIYGQRYDANGVAVGNEFQINTYVTDDQYSSSVTALTGGGFVVTWSSRDQNGNSLGVYGQRYGASGAAVGSEFPANNFTNQSDATVTALTGGGFVVTWISEDSNESGVYGQRYSASGVAVGTEFRVNTYTTGFQGGSSVTALNDGGFVVTWDSNGQDGSGSGVYGQRYSASGTPFGYEFRVNQTTSGDQTASSYTGRTVSQIANGDLVFTWDGNGSNDTAGVFARILTTNQQPASLGKSDFTGDTKTDILWRNVDGTVAQWQMNGSTIVNPALTSITSVPTTWSIAATQDFSGDRKADILWRNVDGTVALWQMEGNTVAAINTLGTAPSNWKLLGSGDFTGDGKTDILWRNVDGTVALWQIGGPNLVVGQLGSDWKVVGSGDFDGNGTSDILWRKNDGSIGVWQMTNGAISGSGIVGQASNNWKLEAVNDFDGNGRDELLWRNSESGEMGQWSINNLVASSSNIFAQVGAEWSVVGSGDFNGDAKGDVLWRNQNGSMGLWQMNGTAILSQNAFAAIDSKWTVAAPLATGTNPDF